MGNCISIPKPLQTTAAQRSQATQSIADKTPATQADQIETPDAGLGKQANARSQNPAPAAPTFTYARKTATRNELYMSNSMARHLSFSQDGTKLLCDSGRYPTSRRYGAYIFDLTTQKPKAESFDCGADAKAQDNTPFNVPHNLTSSPDGTRHANTRWGHVIISNSQHPNEPQIHLKVNIGHLGNVTFAPDNKHFATVSASGQVAIWALEKSSAKKVFQDKSMPGSKGALYSGHSYATCAPTFADRAYSLAFSADGRHLANSTTLWTFNPSQTKYASSKSHDQIARASRPLGSEVCTIYIG